MEKLNYQEFRCDAPLTQRTAEERCTKPVHTELMIRDKRSGALYHFLYLCRKHSGTDKEVVIADGENCDETCLNDHIENEEHVMSQYQSFK